ncbi:hypothetical protein [Secundilactobacillus kimchicus]|uniref:glycoside hydrolase family 78 protein n=1 Tax=Secundilactobacillus kimchicus TaxID=528209 RepID=UPI000A5C33D9|nr:hypothetical protein [Secundilactobacillus kimchicus]
MESKVSGLLAPSHLRVNLLAFAYNVDESATFSWWDHSQDNDCYQVEYQIVISKRAVQLLNHDYQIDTGWVQSSKNSAVMIPQLEGHLVENEVYYWQVRIKDNFGNVSDYSQPEKFITIQYLKKPIYGIWSPNLHKKDDELVHLGNVAFIRSPNFSLNTQEIDSAIITAFSRGSEPEFVQGFELRVNGEGAVIGSARPQAYYDGGEETAIYYNRYDVTQSIKNGLNVIAAIIGGDSPRRAFFWPA